ncbi:hypothetical protein [Streptomyces barringtoniae]|uniref:hypothetical protein n=1 Tax=Streptomyces barringtoniae TaxID=2892029 RepID=UPI001E3F6416|nr:hypothetical protein [Streptomyces barringtoniae]MCC5476868.1 hypothetical protein [Streptomyces barringtoniae]
MEMAQAPKNVEVRLKLPMLEIAGSWEPNDAERRAAWELYVELITRVSVVPLREDEGLLREALTSLYSLFGTAREILRRHGPQIAEPKRNGEYNFGYLAVAMLNYGVRPLLAAWHPALEDWESRRPADRSRRDHERAWPQSAQLRTALNDTRRILAAYADLLAAACGVPNLLGAFPNPRS